MRLLILVIVVVVSQVTLDAECRIACRMIGYDSGVTRGKKCACFEYYLKDDLFAKKLTPQRLPVSE